MLLMSSRPDLRDARTFPSTPALAHSLMTSVNKCHCPVVNMLVRVCNSRCEILPPLELYMVQILQSGRESPPVQLEIYARTVWNLVVMNDLLGHLSGRTS